VLKARPRLKRRLSEAVENVGECVEARRDVVRGPPEAHADALFVAEEAARHDEHALLPGSLCEFVAVDVHGVEERERATGREDTLDVFAVLDERGEQVGVRGDELRDRASSSSVLWKARFPRARPGPETPGTW